MAEKRKESRFSGRPEDITAFSSAEEAAEFTRKRKAEIQARIDKKKAKRQKEQDEQNSAANSKEDEAK